MHTSLVPGQVWDLLLRALLWPRLEFVETDLTVDLGPDPNVSDTKNPERRFYRLRVRGTCTVRNVGSGSAQDVRVSAGSPGDGTNGYRPDPLRRTLHPGDSHDFKVEWWGSYSDRPPTTNRVFPVWSGAKRGHLLRARVLVSKEEDGWSARPFGADSYPTWRRALVRWAMRRADHQGSRLIKDNLAIDEGAIEFLRVSDRRGSSPNRRV